ncbi:MAG: InlB B-repeat-containing protein [Firmicutes bacterium]|nr:InlB B-repeat-containing protein [Bacillota bacterium]
MGERTSGGGKLNEDGKWTVKFDLNYAAAVDLPDSFVEPEASLTKPSNPSRPGFTFEGWFTEKACTNAYDFSSPVTKNFTLYAKWDEITYKVTFGLGFDGPPALTAPAEQTGIKYGEKAVEPAAPNGGATHAFLGWYDGMARLDFNTGVTANLTLTAKWSAKATAPLATPVSGDFRVAGGEAASVMSIEVDRRNRTSMWGSDEEGFLFGDEEGKFNPELGVGMTEMRVYVYTSSAAANAATKATPGGIAYFSVWQDRLTSADGTVSKACSEYDGGDYQDPSNYYIFGVVMIDFLREALGEAYAVTSNNAYFFRVQFVSAGSPEFNSELGSVSAAWLGRNYELAG